MLFARIIYQLKVKLIHPHRQEVLRGMFHWEEGIALQQTEQLLVFSFLVPQKPLVF